MSELVAVRLRIFLGLDYRFTPPTPGKDGQPRRGAGCLYRPLCVARDAHSHREGVVYRGLTGPDRGLHFSCGLADWASNFTAVPDSPPVPADVAGHITQGSGA
jgi:hypothetical protein